MNTKMIEMLFDIAEKEYQAVKAEFIKRCEKLGFPYTFIYHAEDITVLEQKMDILRDLQEAHIEAPKTFLQQVEHQIRVLTKALIEFPYQHSSTSLMSNAVDEWKAQAYSQLLRNELIRLQEWAQD
ncbi:MAG: hypothetical protein GY718_10065 [Lentisphaerae bacterium]|nr:hypothetical protein [Lentisphaerota bacterium]